MTPKYCLYSHSYNVDPAYLKCCSNSFAEKELGCTITPTWTIEKAINTHGGKGFDSLQEHIETVPWRCLAECPRLKQRPLPNYMRANNLSPLLDKDSIIHSSLPDGLNRMLEEGQRGIDPRLSDRPSDAVDENLIIDFEEFDIAVDSREMDYDGEFPHRFIIPRRVYILELDG